MAFAGLTQDAYKFFWEIAFNNNATFFEENRARYRAVVHEPMLALAAALGPVAGEIDPAFNLRPAAVVSRIRRDTRFTKDKSLYRDHVWLAFKHQGSRTSESFVVFVEFERDGYGYGMGMYGPMPGLMGEIRPRILARPSLFLELAGDPALAERFSLTGEQFKRPKMPDAPEALQTWLNRKHFSYVHFDTDVKKTMRPDVLDEIKEGFLIMKPMYRFLMGM